MISLCSCLHTVGIIDSETNHCVQCPLFLLCSFFLIFLNIYVAFPYSSHRMFTKYVTSSYSKYTSVEWDILSESHKLLHNLQLSKLSLVTCFKPATHFSLLQEQAVITSFRSTLLVPVIFFTQFYLFFFNFTSWPWHTHMNTPDMHSCGEMPEWWGCLDSLGVWCLAPATSSHSVPSGWTTTCTVFGILKPLAL